MCGTFIPSRISLFTRGYNVPDADNRWQKIQSDGTFNFGNQLKLMNIIFSLPGNIPSYPAKSNYLLFVSVLLSILINIFDRLFHQQLQR